MSPVARWTLPAAVRLSVPPSFVGPRGGEREGTPPYKGVREFGLAIGAEPAVVIGLVAVALVAHGFNMFNSPSITAFGDEGIYTSQAWAILREHRLSPYTYFYDHAPGGWILSAGWMWLTGGPFTFGSALDGGRMLMLLLHVAMAPLLYHLARKLGCGAPLAALAVLLFSLSPLAVYYQRLVLLDNIMLFWALLSLDLLLDGWGRLSRTALSGICFGLAVLTKETALFLTPAMLYIAVQERRQHQGRFAVSGWLLPMLIVVSWYPLYALLNGELLPAGQSVRIFLFSANSGSGVSLVDALKWQTSRGGGGLFSLNSQFWQLVRLDWLPRDPLLLVAGPAATALNLLRGVRDRRALAAGLLGALPLLYLARGGIVFNFYILVAIPFLCLNLAVLLAPLFARLPSPAAVALALAAAVALSGGYWQTGRAQPLYLQSPGLAGREAITWIKGHLPPQSMIIADDDFWTDLHEPSSDAPGFPNVHSHWKVAADPAVRSGIFRDDWRTVDYLIMTPGLEIAFNDSGNTLALDALRNAHLVKRWSADGGVVELWKVDKAGPTEAALLVASASYIDGSFARNGGYMSADGASADGAITSESQSYAMLRAVWLGDRDGFNRAWSWTRTNLVDGHGLLAWLWQGGTVSDYHTAADADTDAALALLLASRRWDDPELLDAGRRMVQAIWEGEVVTVNGTPYITAGDWVRGAPVIAVNPSYFAPYAYHIFQEIDPSHDWLGVIDSGYRVLFDASAAPLGAARSAGLPPDWVGLDPGTGALGRLQLDRGDTTLYGYDATRTWWRIALDLRWSGDGRAEAYLRQAGFLRDEVRRDGVPGAVYGHDGSVVERVPSLAGIAGALAALLTLDPAGAHAMHAAHIVGGAARKDRGFAWGDANDLYAQAWGWFATALYAGALPDLWHGR
jgi:endo-1,4-beta-D-glucanase Y/4-amino-4-deoxy-L-arabinose transferase-like glycosyltransferase